MRFLPHGPLSLLRIPIMFNTGAEKFTARLAGHYIKLLLKKTLTNWAEANNAIFNSYVSGPDWIATTQRPDPTLKHTLILLAISKQHVSTPCSCSISRRGMHSVTRCWCDALYPWLFPTANLLACQLIFPPAHRTGKFYAYICACHFPMSK